jgi:tripartite-type tricarboxylate transporter receptor subunit TctC
MRSFLGLALAILVSCGLAGAESAAPGWPTRPIVLIVPYPAGSGTDTAARVFAPKISDRLGQPVVIENRVGAGGKLGVELLAKSSPDGHTIGFVTSSTQALAPHLQPKPRYDVLTDFEPVGLIGHLPFVLVSSAKNNITTVKELIARARQNPGKITFGSAGVTTDTYFASALFSSMAGIELTHIPYQASAAAIPDLLSGRLDVQFATIAPVIGNIKDGGLRALAVTGTRRVDSLPKVPTMIEAGFAGYEAGIWMAIAAPAKTPQPIVQRLHAAISEALRETSPALEKQGIQMDIGTPEALRKLTVRDLQKWQKFIATTAGTAK